MNKKFDVSNRIEQKYITLLNKLFDEEEKKKLKVNLKKF